MSTLLRQARDARGWSSAGLRHQLRLAAKRRELRMASDDSLRVLLSRWENGHSRPDAMYRMLLEEVFDLPAAALGIEEVGSDLAPATLRPLVTQAAFRGAAPQPVLDYFAGQLLEHSRLDNIAGPTLLLATASAQLTHLEQLADSGAPEAAHLVARYAEFVGWLYQDSGDPQRSLEVTNRSIDYANLAGDPELATYCTMRKSNVFSDLGEHQLAAAAARQALAAATAGFPALLPICLRQQALTEAALSHEKASRDALERALTLGSPAAGSSLASYCTPSYLWMELSVCLLAAGRPADADQACEVALAEWPQAQVRDRSLCLARRAVAGLELRDIDLACSTALQAVEGVRLAPSGRAIHLLRAVVTRLRPYGRNALVKELTVALAEVA